MSDTIGANASMGRVESVSNEICSVVGMSNVSLSSLVEFSSGGRGIVVGFNTKQASVIVMNDYSKLKKGDLVRIIDTSLRVPVGNQLLGRVVDPLCEPLDGLGMPDSEQRRYIESPAKPIYERGWVNKPFQTGYLIIDSQIPIGLGQRELLVGEKQAGSSDVAVEIIANQTRMNQNVKCVYVAIDADTAKTKRHIEYLRECGALDNTVVIVGRTSESATLNYIAPMTGVTIAEWFASKGEDVLVVFDDLSRHAKVYRQLSLLLNRPASREAYPGDIFYLHARLLERCGAFSEQVGGGSVTALPIVETQNEEATDYITTNLMSITDGHILFRQSLANKGMQPPIDSGFSVSRIGGRAQIPIIRHLSDEVRKIVTRYHEVERFMSFGADYNADTVKIIEQGKRVLSFFYQQPGQFLAVHHQMLLMYFLISGQALDWDSMQMDVVKKQLLTFSTKPEHAKLLQRASLVTKVSDAKPFLDLVLSDFKKDATTLKPEKKSERVVAETETVASLLREERGAKDAKN